MEVDMPLPLYEKLKNSVLSLGAEKAEILPAQAVRYDRTFRDMCASNVCGNYGQCWMCPPDVGEIDVLIRSLSVYEHVLIYQTITKLKNPQDYSEIMQVGNIHNRLAQSLKPIFREAGVFNAFFFGVGGCRLCPICAKKTGEDCRHPELAMPSLEAYGIDVAHLAEAADMTYFGDKESATYFGAVYFRI